MDITDRLLSLLARQRETLQRLLDLAAEGRTCVKDRRHDRLHEITDEQTQLMRQHSHCSADIERVIRQFATHYQLSAPVTLLQIVPFLPDDRAAQVRHYHGELTTAADTLQREGQITWVLIQQALRFAEFTMRTIGQAKEPAPVTYQALVQSGAPRAMRMLVDSRA